MSATPYSNLLADRRSTPPRAESVTMQWIPPLWQKPIEIALGDTIRFVLRGPSQPGEAVLCTIANDAGAMCETFVLTSTASQYDWTPSTEGTYHAQVFVVGDAACGDDARPSPVRLPGPEPGYQDGDPDAGTIHVGSETC